MQTKENWAIDDRYARPEEWQNLKKSLPNSCQMPDATGSNSKHTARQIETRTKSVGFLRESTRKQLEAKSGKMPQ